MPLFGKRVKAEAPVSPRENVGAGSRGAHSVKVLGSGCARCKAMEAAVGAALTELKADVPVEHVADLSQIAAYGVMSLPALVVDERVVCSGRAPSTRQAVEILSKALS